MKNRYYEKPQIEIVIYEQDQNILNDTDYSKDDGDKIHRDLSAGFVDLELPSEDAPWL